MCPAVPMIMAKRPGSQAQCLELRGEVGFLIGLEAAQIEPERAVGDAADHRARQPPQRLLQLREASVLSFDGAHGEPIARQLLEGQRATTDLAEERGRTHLVALTERVLERCAQTSRLSLHVREWSCQQP